MTIDVINKWLAGVQNDLTDNYNKLGIRASGNWPNELDPFVEATPLSYRVGMMGAKYTGAIENGRKPNSNQYPEAVRRWVGWAGNTFLKDWVNNKGINVSPFAVAWKIARDGWQVPNRFNAGGLVSDVVTNERGTQLVRDIAFSTITDFKSDILKNIQ